MHFTYVAPSGDLCQGDVLRRTDALDAILKQIHPHYVSDEYKLFMILTQTCDLVRRGRGECSSRYIEIATVRPVDVVLERQLRKFQDVMDIRAGVCSNKAYGRLLDFVKSLLNNNASEYFFLREQSEFGFVTPMCAFLRESVPLKASSHYGALVSARVGSLNPMFQAKLGWLVGHIYSRVATDDWVPNNATEAEFDGVAKGLVDSVSTWVDDRSLRSVKKKIDPKLSNEVIRSAILAAKSVEKKTEILNRVCEIIGEKFPDQYVNLKNLQQVLSSDNELKGLF